MSEKPVNISAVISTYNNRKYICRAIDSVLAQSYKPAEIIVVDDGSTDDTQDVVAGYGDKVRYIRKDNGGASSARNAGIREASCEWIAFLDGDDEWLEDRLADQVELLGKGVEVNWICSNYYTCLCISGRRAIYTPQSKVREILRQSKSISYYKAVVSQIAGCTDTMLIKKQCLIDAGLFSEQQKQANDLDMWWRVACRWPQIGIVARPGAVYHMQVGGSITKKRFPAELYIELILRHREIASEHGCRDDFDKMASFMVRRWLRSMLFHRDRAGDIRVLLAELDCVIPLWYGLLIRAGIICPALTHICLRSVSRISRALNLRKRLVPPPDKMKN